MLLSPQSSLDIAPITGWIFDLDNTIYPAESGLFLQVSARMTHYLEQQFNLSTDEAFALRQRLFERYGTTGRGLIEEHGIDPTEFLDYVHDIDLSGVEYDAELDQAIGRLPGKKIVFTNGTTQHASRILEGYKIDHHFDYCYDIIAADHCPKPMPMIYDAMLAKTGIDPKTAVMIEDMAINLKPAHDRGITTIWLNHRFDWRFDSAEYIDYIARDLKSFLKATH
jgi:putative hydrolase of the HAD superfamily